MPVAEAAAREEYERLFGLKPKLEPRIANTLASERVSQPQASPLRPLKDTSRMTRCGRITKSTAQIQSIANHALDPDEPRRHPQKPPCPIVGRNNKKRSNMVDKPDDSTVEVPRQTRKRQPKGHRKRLSGAVDNMDKVLQSKHHDTEQRASRRLAHEPPQFGMFAEQSQPGLRNHAPPKSIAAKGAKPRGISRSGREGMNRSKRSKEKIRGLNTYKFDSCLRPLHVYAQLREDSATIWPICYVGI